MTRRTFRPIPRPPKDDRAVSVVIGAIMMTTMVLAGVIVYQLTFVPVKIENAEASHMAEIEKQLAAIKADLDRQLENRTLVPLANPLSLSRGPTAALANAVVPSTLQFTPGNKPVVLRLDKLMQTTMTGDGVPPLDPPRPWEEVSTTATYVEGVHEIINFRLHIAAFDPFNNDLPYVAVRLTNPADEPAGDLEVYVREDPDFPAEKFLNIRTHDAQGNLLYDNSVVVHSSSGFPAAWIDLLNDDYRFDRVIKAASKPLTIELVSIPGSRTTMDAEFTITYTTQAPGGGMVVVGVGTPAAAVSARFASGTLEFQSDNAYFVDQAYVLENGALILDQGQTATFAVRPSFGIAWNPTTLMLDIDITLPALVGESASVTSLGTAIVYTRGEAPQYIVGRAPDFQIDITTGYPQLWERHWRDQLARAGMEDEGCDQDPKPATCNFHIGPGTAEDSLRLNLYGKTVTDADANNPVYDTFVVLRQAAIKVELK